jgi:cytochrome c-type biogenesis protein CcmE
MKPKNQRLALVSAAIVAVLVAVLLAMWGLRDKASYFYTPSDLNNAAAGKSIRLGGMVEEGSLVHIDALTIQFSVTDGKKRVSVMYRGITPDLFREGSGVVAEGKLVPLTVCRIDPNTGRASSCAESARLAFNADTILAKHDERYMPPELGNLAAEHKAGKTLEK